MADNDSLKKALVTGIAYQASLKRRFPMRQRGKRIIRRNDGFPKQVRIL